MIEKQKGMPPLTSATELPSRPTFNWKYCLIAVAIGLSLALFRHFVAGWANDFAWATTMARNLLAGQNPYAGPQRDTVPYPLPAVIFGLPLAGLDETAAADLFLILSSIILAYGILQSGERWRLFIFISAPFWCAIQYRQWSILVTAAWFFPALAPLLVLIKPQIALPVALSRPHRRGLWIALGVLGLSLTLLPTWPLDWLALTRRYEHAIPLLGPLGPLLLLSVLNWAYPPARLLFLSALLPHRSVYDLTALGLIPRSLRQMALFVVISWLHPLFVLWMGLPDAYNVPYLLSLLYVLMPREFRLFPLPIRRPA